MASEAYGWRFFAAVGLALSLASQGLVRAGFPPGSAPYQAAVALFLALFGGLCLRNWRTCGALHCAVTGPAYLLLALAALLVAAGAPWGMGAVWLGVVLVVAAGMAAPLLDPGADPA